MKKEWYDVKTPIMFNGDQRLIGRTPVTKTAGKSEFPAPLRTLHNLSHDKILRIGFLVCIEVFLPLSRVRVAFYAVPCVEYCLLLACSFIV